MDKAPMPLTVVSSKVAMYIEDYKNRHGLTTEEMCQKLGKKKQYLSRIKKPGLRMFTRNALEIAKILDVDTDKFLDDVRSNATEITEKAIGEQFLKSFPNPMIRASILKNKKMITAFVIEYEKEYNNIIIEA